MKFVVSAPPYTDNSAWFAMLYFLRDELKSLGDDAEIVLIDTIKLISDDTIVVCPEVVEGNPLKQ